MAAILPVVSSLFLAVVVVLTSGTGAASASSLTGYALLQEDGSLRVRGRTVRLFGIHIPPTDRQCRTFLRPARCAPRAVLALDLQLRRFVSCNASLDSI